MSAIKIQFIINPISGGKSKKKIAELIAGNLNPDRFLPDIKYSEYAGHAAQLAATAISDNYAIIVAVGGDGTINEIAAQVSASNKILAIIPYGSGNGLARFLNIPLHPIQAIKAINALHTTTIDTGILNGRPFFNMAGIGFDAHISQVFSANKKRGFSTYIKMVLVEFLNYKPIHYQLNIDGKVVEKNAFAISIANSSQYGNNIHIAPDALITDGIFEVCIIKPFKSYQFPLFLYRLVFKKAVQSGMVEIIKGKDIKLELPAEGISHIDGEPFPVGKHVEILVKPLSLRIVVPV